MIPRNIQLALNNLAEVVEECDYTANQWHSCETEKPELGESVIVLTAGGKWYAFIYYGKFFNQHTQWMRIITPKDI